MIVKKKFDKGSHDEHKQEQHFQNASHRAKLSIVSTPIGNLKDITFRAIETLKEASFIICEDTRVTKKLLNAYSIKSTLCVYNDHSNENDRRKIIELIIEKSHAAIVSDAGTPMISDPGYKLVRECIKYGIKIEPIPGPSAVLASICASGLPTDKFMFLGFLPKKEVKNTIEKLKNTDATLIFFESAKRLIKTIEIVKEIMDDPEMCVAREITKIFETIKTGKASELISFFKQNILLGECTVLINNRDNLDFESEKIKQAKELLEKLLKITTTSNAVKIIANSFKLNKNMLYNLALRL